MAQKVQAVPQPYVPSCRGAQHPLSCCSGPGEMPPAAPRAMFLCAMCGVKLLTRAPLHLPNTAATAGRAAAVLSAAAPTAGSKTRDHGTPMGCEGEKRGWRNPRPKGTRQLAGRAHPVPSPPSLLRLGLECPAGGLPRWWLQARGLEVHTGRGFAPHSA